MSTLEAGRRGKSLRQSPVITRLRDELGRNIGVNGGKGGQTLPA